VLGAFIVLIVVAFPKGIVGVIETIRLRLRRTTSQSAALSHRVETAE
jgi:branched-chain amino acid transport system permease protein